MEGLSGPFEARQPVCSDCELSESSTSYWALVKELILGYHGEETILSIPTVVA